MKVQDCCINKGSMQDDSSGLTFAYENLFSRSQTA